MNWIPASEWPYTTRFFETPAGRMAYVDEGQGEPVVLVHGTPSCSTEWRHVMKRLLPHRRVIAMDHLGFGQSDRPPDWRTYSFAWHRENLRALLEQQKEPFHLVVHDVGGPIALPLVAELGRRVRSLTIVQSWLWDLGDVDTSFGRNRSMMGSAFMRWAYLSWNFSPKMMVKLAWGKRLPLTKELHREFIDQFPTKESRTSLWGFVRAIVDEGTTHSLAPEAARLAETNVPTTVVWGAADGMVKPMHLERWKTVLPGARYVELADVGHFPQVEAPEDVATALLGR